MASRELMELKESNFRFERDLHFTVPKSLRYLPKAHAFH